LTLLVIVTTVLPLACDRVGEVIAKKTMSSFFVPPRMIVLAYVETSGDKVMM